MACGFLLLPHRRMDLGILPVYRIHSEMIPASLRLLL